MPKLNAPEARPPEVSGNAAGPDSPVGPDGDPGDPAASRHRWVALAVVTLASFLDNLDANAVTVVLPDIQRDLGAGFTTAQWTLAGYALAYALFLITGGRLGDIHGRKRLFMSGVAGFVLASAVCGAAPVPEVLVAGRFAQGFMAALMVPQAVSVIVTMFRKDEWARAFAVLGAALSVGSVGGPLLGGLLTELDLLGLGWRAIFLINVPLGAIALVLCARSMPESRSDEPLRLDVVGVVLLTAASLGLLYPLVQGREEGWPGWMFGLMGCAVVLFAVFVRQQRLRHRRDGSALIPPTLFRHRSAVVGLTVTLLVFSGVASFFLVLTYHLQTGLGWSVMKTALVTAAWPVGITATFQIAWRHGSGRGRLCVGAGSSLMAGGALLTLLTVWSAGGGDLSWAQLAGAELVMGCGMGLTTPVLTAVVLGDIPPQDAGAGSGVLNATIQFSSAAGVALLGALYFGSVELGAGVRASAEHFSSATSSVLWCNVGVFVLTAALSSLLPKNTEKEIPKNVSSVPE
ncbi:MFS transporter [Streptomyces sp. WAC05374]|uniref:MFS transporter n=1 Tax=Streptomyces sp. WAC05374 TaxID=2487420 RepID=UPI0013574CA1|nr:MFS transporter [Streptomyces sp. WAC05374]